MGMAQYIVGITEWLEVPELSMINLLLLTLGIVLS